MGRPHYNEFFNLNTNPFGETPDPKFFFASETHRRALHCLREAIDQGKGFSLMTGEVGMGKTLISRILVESTQSKTSHIDSALVLYPYCTESELIRSVCGELAVDRPRREASGVENAEGHKNDLDRLNEFLIQNTRHGRKTVLIVDEAQNMPYATLETIRLLSNLETNSQKLIHTIFCAQPEFLKRLGQPELRQLQQRIGTTIRLDNFTVTETERYIKHRIERAGGSNFLRFDADACYLIQKSSQGIPRKINHICDQLIALAGKRSVRLISKPIARELLGSSPRKTWISQLWGRAEIASS